MIAMVFQPHASFPIGLVGSLLVLGVGASGLLTWLASNEPRWRLRRALVGAAVAAALFFLVIRAVASQVICGACIGCDPWWLEYFWLCI